MPLSKDELKVKVGNRIRQLRIMKNLTIEEVANNAGIEYTQLSRIEHGKINTSLYHAYIISQSLSIDLTEIFSDLNK